MIFRLKQNKWIALALALLLSVQLIPCVYASAAAIDEDTAFEYRITKAEGEAPGNILVQLFVQTDPNALITTAGATLVINTDYVDVVNKKGTPITDSYKQDVVQFGKSFPITAEPVGEDRETFASIKGLSLASYNQKTKNLYLFVCGMAIAGLKVPQKSLMARYYLQAKADGKLPADAIRLASKSELESSCPSKAIYATQISSKKEIGTAPSALTLNADETLIETGDTPAPDTTAPATTVKEDKKTSSTTAKSTTAAADTKTTKKVSDMTEKEVAEELENKIESSKSFTPSDAQKQSDVYKAYEKAVKEAQEVLEDKNATPLQKRQALENLRNAEKALEQVFPEVADQLQGAQTPKTGIWLYIGIGAAIVAVAAIIAVIVIKKKKQTA